MPMGMFCFSYTIGWFVMKITIYQNYPVSPPGIVVCNWLVIFSVCFTLMCTFDPTGRTFVKLKATRRRQRNLTTYTLRLVPSSLHTTVCTPLGWYDLPYTLPSLNPQVGTLCPTHYHLYRVYHLHPQVGTLFPTHYYHLPYTLLPSLPYSVHTQHSTLR